jgi:hypothetical protein
MITACWIAFFTGVCGLRLEAQTAKYAYDAAGNRIFRNKEVKLTSPPPDVDATTSFEEVISETSISIYPNPTQGLLRVEISGGEIPPGARIYLYNISGVLIQQWTGVSKANTMDISAQPSGTYVMRIMLDKEKISTWKIVKTD